MKIHREGAHPKSTKGLGTRGILELSKGKVPEAFAGMRRGGERQAWVGMELGGQPECLERPRGIKR